jgi:solute carrier family 25 aspartate/glutamate transporter 12/13
MNTILNGLISGYIGAIIVYPIDLIKTNMQNQLNAKYKNGIHCFTEIIKKHGFSKLYNGSVVQLIGIGPEKSIKLFINNSLLNYNIHPIISGCLAGASQVIVSNPIEIIKIQYQLNIYNKNFKFIDAIKNIHNTNQSSHFNLYHIIKNLYKGSSLCLLRDIPFSGIYFPTYLYIKNQILNNQININPTIISGFIAAIPAAYLVTPFDVIKTRYQSYKYKNIIDCMNNIYINDGIKGFWIGGKWRVIKSAPQFAITLYVYEKLNN